MNRKAQNALSARIRKTGYRNKLLSVLGGKCIKCGFSDLRALCIDHINGGGCRETKTLGGNRYSAILKRVQLGSKDYQVLCANCNMIKMTENDERTERKYSMSQYIIPKPLQPCGTAASYRRGCRCSGCVLAHNQVSRVSMRCKTS